MIQLLVVIVGLAILGATLVLMEKVPQFSESIAMTASTFGIGTAIVFYTVFGTNWQIELMASDGLSQWWGYAVSWYPAYIIMALTFAGAIRATGQHLTLPDRFIKYGTVPELLSSVTSFLYLMPLDVLFVLGLIVQLFTDYTVPLIIAIPVMAVLLIMFTRKYGWATYSVFGVASFVFMTLGIGLACLALVSLVGGYDMMISLTSEYMKTPWFGDFSGFMGLMSNAAFALWFIRGVLFLVDPMMWQRISLVETEGAAKKGMFYAILFWLFFDIVTVLSGLAMNILGEPWYLDTVYYLLEPTVGGLAVLAILCAAINGGSAYLHSAGMIYAHNISKAIGKLPSSALSSDESTKKLVNEGIMVLGVISTVLVLILNYLMPDDPTTLAWTVNSSIQFGGLFLTSIIGGVYLRDKVKPLAVTLSIVLGLATTVILMLYGFINPTALSIASIDLSLGVALADASAAPLIDASFVWGFLASIVGFVVGQVIDGRR
jgi:hypothetical protein